MTLCVRGLIIGLNSGLLVQNHYVKILLISQKRLIHIYNDTPVIFVQENLQYCGDIIWVFLSIWESFMGLLTWCPVFKSNWTHIKHRFNTCRSLRWRHNGRDSVSNHQPHDYLLNCLFRRRSKNTSKLRVTDLCVGNSPGPVNSPHKWPVTRKMFPFIDVIMWNLRVPDLQKKCSDFTRVRGYLARRRPCHMINP